MCTTVDSVPNSHYWGLTLTASYTRMTWHRKTVQIDFRWGNTNWLEKNQVQGVCPSQEPHPRLFSLWILILGPSGLDPGCCRSKTSLKSKVILSNLKWNTTWIILVEDVYFMTKPNWNYDTSTNYYLLIISHVWLKKKHGYTKYRSLSVGAAQIASQDRSMWRTLRHSAGQAQQWVSELAKNELNHMQYSHSLVWTLWETCTSGGEFASPLPMLYEIQSFCAFNFEVSYVRY